MSKRLAFVSGFFVGAFTGWVLGILSAPQSGRETIDSLSEKAIELRDRAEETAEQVRQRVMGRLESTANLDADYTR